LKSYSNPFGPDFNVSSRPSIVYGGNFWDSPWEPSQQAFLNQCLDSQDLHFIDVGAAIGAYTLMAAAKNVPVLAFEPGSQIFSELRENVFLNPEFSNKVELFNGFVVSKKDSKRRLGGFAQKTSSLDYSQTEYILSDFLKDKMVIKMDIEGAEWALLQDTQFTSLLSQKEFILFLSVHIGFHRFDYQNFWQKIVFRFEVLKEIYALFMLKRKFAYSFELKDGKLEQLKVRRKNLFNGNGWHNPIVFSNSTNMMRPIIRFTFSEN